MAEHTKIPWRVEAQPAGGWWNTAVETVEREAREPHVRPAVHIAEVRNQDDAEFVVLSVNSHDALTEALETALPYLATLAARRRRDGAAPALRQAHAALALSRRLASRP